MKNLTLLASLLLTLAALLGCQADPPASPSSDSGIQGFKGTSDNGLRPGSPLPFSGGFRGY